MSFIMVLSDGETYTDLQGCKIIEVPDEYEAEDIDNLVGLPDQEISNTIGVEIIRYFDAAPRNADYM
jgi:hypothetical protein